MFLRYGKYRNQLNHYLRNHTHHQRIQRDPGINMETFEEVPDAVKEFKEGVIGCAYSIGRLRLPGSQMGLG
jgi:hypothetical protein